MHVLNKNVQLLRTLCVFIFYWVGKYDDILIFDGDILIFDVILSSLGNASSL